MFEKSLLDQWQFLTSLLESPTSLTLGHSLEEAFEAKFKLMQELRAQSVRSISQNVTNRTRQRLMWHGWPLFWDYRRQQLLIDEPVKESTFHPGLIDRHSCLGGFFTTSGQVAVHGVLTSLAKLFGTYRLSTPHGIYFESQRAYDFVMQLASPKESDPNLLIIDSGAFHPGDEQQLPELITKANWVLVDSTCWDSEDPLFQKIMALLQGKLVYLVRSHLKLDCFGSEYSLLGSATILGQSDHDLFNMLRMTISMIGGFPSFDQIYPFLRHPEHRKLTRERTRRIQKNTERLLNVAKSSLTNTRTVGIEEFSNGLYFIVEFEPDGKNWPQLLEKWRALGGTPGHTCDSFGFDGFTLVHFDQPIRGKRHSVIRVCGSDLPENEMKDAEETIRRVMMELN